MTQPAIDIAGVSKKFRIYHERNLTLKSAVLRRRRSVHEDFSALRDISFQIPSGSKFAIVGGNGSGKSTLLKCVARILQPDAGDITAHGRVAALLEIGSGFHPELSGKENIYLNGAILGIPRSHIRRKFDDIVDFSGVERFIDQPVKNYSSGMYVRLAFAVAVNIDPEILLVDEVLAVGDAVFQQRCTERFEQLCSEGRTVVIVSHAVPVLRSLCDRAAWLKDGQLQELGAAPQVLDNYSKATQPAALETENARVRGGTGEIRIDAVEVLDGSGQSCAMAIPPGAKVTLRVHYLVSEIVQQPVFVLAIEAFDGARVWTGNSFDAELPGRLPTGPGVIELTIPNVPLGRGEYVVNTGVIEHTDGRTVDFARNVARLRVGGGSRTEAGYVALQGQWRAGR